MNHLSKHPGGEYLGKHFPFRSCLLTPLLHGIHGGEMRGIESIMCCSLFLNCTYCCTRGCKAFSPWLMPHRQSCATCVCVRVCVFANRLLLSTLKCKHPTCGMSVMDSRYRWSLFVACLQPQFPSHSLLQGEAQRDILRGWPDFVIIHWPKSLPCTHRAIFIPGWMYFLGYIIAQPLGADFHFWEQVFVFQTVVKSGKQSYEFAAWSHLSAQDDVCGCSSDVYFYTV